MLMLPPSPRRSPRTAGFSLVELLVGLVIFGILVSIAAPRFERLTSFLRSRSAADRLSADLAYARMMAVREGRTVSLRFGAGTGGAYAITRDGATVDTLKSENLSAHFPGISVTRAPGTIDRVAFDSRGLLRQGSVEIRIQRGDARVQKLTVSSVGRIYRAQQ